MKPRWFQIHLSTALVLMLCASGLLWLNLKPNCEAKHRDSIGAIKIQWNQEFYFTEWERGWPCTMNWGVQGSPPHIFSRFELRQSSIPVMFNTKPQPPKGIEGRWEPGWIFVNLSVAVLVLMGLNVLMESRLRNREVHNK